MIPKTRLHTARVFEQVQRNLINLQRDLRSNALTHKQMALAQSPDIETLRTFVTDCASEYQRRLKWHDEHWQDEEKRNRLFSHMREVGWEPQDVFAVHAALQEHVVALDAAPRRTYADIIHSCDMILEKVEAPESLWPE